MNEFKADGDNLTEVGGKLYANKRPILFGALLNVAIFVLCILLFIEVLFNVFFMGIYVVNISMQPTLTGAVREDSSGGDFIYVNRFAKPDYGDIVVVYREANGIDGYTERGNIIKRAIAFGGDKVEIKHGILYLNGKEVNESYLDFDNIDLEKSNFEEHTVKENCMFLLGDNRDNSTDSRDCGDYPMENLVGVMPQWSYNIKEFTTSVYTFFNFTIFGK